MTGDPIKRRTVLVLATMDTKGEESAFLRGYIENLGLRARLIDSGVVGRPTVVADVSREEVAEAGGTQLSSLLKLPTREEAAPVMTAGAKKIVGDLVENKQADAIISLGGTQGTTLSTA